jgi:2-polyprenyl-3-methyl-5-hydroxy-6-metoxy-1,4-benzoquinol methylase
VWSVAKDFEYFSVEDEFTYYSCANCKTIFIHPVPVEQLKKIYPSNYYSFVNKSKNFVVRLKEWLDKLFFKKILKQLPAQPINVLDVGGGTGWMLDVLKKTDKRIAHTQVVDIDVKARGIAEEKGHAYFEGTIETFTTDKLFHLILMLNLVEHVANPLAVLQKTESLLAPGGIIVIKTPNTLSWDARLYKKSYWGGLHCPRHWVIFSETSFRILLQSTQLKIKKLQYTQGAPFWAFSIIAALSRNKIIRTSAKNPIIFHWLFAPLSAIFAVFDFVRKPFAKTSQMFILLGKDENH